MSGGKHITSDSDGRPVGPARSARAGEVYRLAAGLAHDLNTILTTIYGYCETALESLHKDSPERRSIVKIIEAANRARELTGRLLDPGQLSPAVKQHVILEDILSDSLEFVMPSARENISLNLQIKSPGILAEAVPSQLFRLFMNIAVNALRAMQEKGGTLTVILDSVVESDGKEPGDGQSHALIRFADTGKGMDQETAARIFEPYFRADRNDAGTGLGLTVVQDIVNEMNGTLKVQSRPGEGTVIDIILPAVIFGSHAGKS